MTVVAEYEGWLHAVANRMLGWSGHPDHPDLVQEGRIAIWRAEATFDPDLGAAPAWVTKAAEMRMRDLAHGHGQPFGREATRGKREVEVVVHLEELVEPDELTPAQADIAEIAMWAYHSGQINRAISVLTCAQADAVREFLRDGIMTSTQRAAWVKARHNLASELEGMQ